MSRMWKDFECADCWNRHSTKTWWEACHKGCPRCGGTLVPTFALGHYDTDKPDDAPEAWWGKSETVDKIIEGPKDMAKRYEENVLGKEHGIKEKIGLFGKKLQEIGKSMQKQQP